MDFNKFMSQRGGIGGLFDNSDDQAMAEIQKNRQLWEQLQVPELTWENLLAENYSPEQAVSNTVQEDPLIRSAQMSALAKMAGLADTGLSAEDEAAFMKAKTNANQMARGNRDAVAANATARGVGGSGMEFALKEIGNQEAATRAQQGGMDQAAASARQRALYNQAYGQQLAGVRGQDYTANRGNADILNQFNMANTNTANQGQLFNIGNRQGMAEKNQTGRQNTQQNNFNNQVTKIGGLSGANTGVANHYYGQSAANADARSKDMDNFMSGMKMMGGGM